MRLLAEALEVLEQRALAALELLFADLLDRPHQVAERAHERQRAGVQRLDLGEQALEQRSQAGAVGLSLRELLARAVASASRIAGRRAVSSRADLLAERVEPREQLLGEPAGGRDVVGVAVAPPLGGGRGEAGVVVAFDGAPGVQCLETLVEQIQRRRCSA